MPVYPPSWEPLLKTGNYPHLAKHDARIWERFLDEYAGNFLLVAYDVAFGGFLPSLDVADEATRLGYQYSSALKVDAVAVRGDEVWVIEVKPQAGVSAIGAALCYTIMAEKDGFTPLPLLPVVVTDRASPDIKQCAEALGVTLVESPEPAGTATGS